MTLATVKRPGLMAFMAGGVGLLLGASAWGQPGSPSRGQGPPRGGFRLVYHAPAGCPDGESLRAQVVKLVGTGWLARPTAFPGTIELTILPHAGSYWAHLTMVDAWGRGGTRPVLEGKTCREVVDAMALIVVMRIEQPVASTPSPPPVSAPPLLPPPPAGDQYGEAGLATGMDWRVGPRVAFGGGLMVGIRWRKSPISARLAASYWDTGEVAVAEASARFQLLSARIDLCPLEPRIVGELVAPLCGAAEFGVLMARGVGPDLIQWDRVASPWAALAVAPRLRLTLARFFGELGVDLGFPLLRKNFALGGRMDPVIIHSIPPVAVALRLGVGVRLP